MRSKRAIYNIITNIILQLVAIVYGFVVPKIIIDYFGSDVNGLVASITQFLAYITLLESGFGPVIKATLYKPIARRDKNAIASILKTSEKFFRRIALILVLYIAILCCVFPLIVGADFDAIITISLVIIIGISTFAEYYFGMTYRLFLQAEQKTYIISIIQAATYILGIIVVVVLALLGCNVLLIKLAVGLVFVIRPIAQNAYVRKKYYFDLKNASNDYPIKQKWDGLAQHIAATIHENTDITILTLFGTLSEVSVYSVYYLVVTGIRRIIRSFSDGIDALFGNMMANKEKDNLKKTFSTYETIYILITAILFTCTMELIVPFVSIFTQGVFDANYIRPVFGALLVISEYFWAIRQPYNLLVKAAGHFKETRRGAWIECLCNIIISVALVNWLGIVGVAIGTTVAMTIRTIEFVYHTNKYILNRSMWESLKKILLAVIETIFIILICSCFPFLESTNYLNWIINALVVLVMSVAIISVPSIIFFRKDYSSIKTLFKIFLKRKSI